MKDRTKDRIKDGFGCLVNNAAAMRGAKNGPLWLTIIMFVFSVLLPVLPLFISAANTKGSAFINSNTYGLERYITEVATSMKDAGNEVLLDDQHAMSVKGINYDEYVTCDPDDESIVTDAKPVGFYIDGVTNQYDLVVYTSNRSGSSKHAKNLNKLVSARRYKTGSIDKMDVENDPEGTKYYLPTYIIIFNDTVYVVVCYEDKTITSSLGGNFSNVKANDACLETLLTVKDKEGNVIAPAMTNIDYLNGVLKNFKTFLNKTYDAIKWKNTLVTSAIYLGIFVGLSLFMGLLMWLMTRGKNNPNNYFSLWLCMKIEARLGLAPGLITFILGLFLTQYASMIFILTVGLRVMWISMKELRPVQQ